MTMPAIEGSVWVVSDVAPDDGTYVVSVQVGDDFAMTLPRERVIAYAIEVLTVCAHAAYDEAVLAQAQTMGIPVAVIGRMIADLRAGRDHPDDEVTAPLRFEPIVSATTQRGMVDVSLNGQRFTQWSVAKAEGHALHVLQVAATVDLDAGYRHYLIGEMGLDDAAARACVGDLANHRPSEVE